MRVRAEGFEPSRSFEHRHLKPACLPFHHARRAHERTAFDHIESVGRSLLTWLHLRRQEGGASCDLLEEFETVQRLIAAGMNDCAIARQTGIPRGQCGTGDCRPTIRARSRLGTQSCGVHTRLRLHSQPQRIAICSASTWATAASHEASACWRLRIILDDKYPRHHRPLPRGHRRTNAGPAGSDATPFRQLHRGLSVLETLAVSFPQHGPGRKHLRPIRLEPWQEVLVKEATEDFIRGLIDSDGCRVVANDRGVRSVRYHFSNRSDDIRGLFCAALDELASHGRGRAGSRSPSIARPRSRALTSSSAQKRDGARRTPRGTF